MNEKLKGILKTSWNEPRHFFFWVAMLTFTALGILAIVLTGGLRMEGGRWFLLAVALVCCLVVSVLGFLLAWIPAGRRFLSFLLAHRFLTLAGLITLVGLFYAVENW